MRREAEPAEAGAPPAIVHAPRLAPAEAARRWAALLQQIFEVNPLALIAAAALFSFDTPGPVTFATGGFFALNIVEGNLVTPTLLRRKMPLNPVSIFVGLLFWSWLWGITGALLAVPLTVMVKIICDHVTGLQSLGTLLDS